MRTPYATVSVVLALVGAVLLGSWVLRPETVEYAVARPPAATAPATTAAEPVPDGGGPVVRSAALPAPAVVVAPERLTMDGLGVDAPVVEVGVDEDGLVDVPDDGSLVGWYRWSAAPGGPGTTVLVGHVDTAADGPGALFDLARTEAGQRLQMRSTDGSVRAYAVVSLQSYPKTALPAAELFRRDGDPALVVVTCGGPFDRATRTYAENVVVTAVPVP